MSEKEMELLMMLSKLNLDLDTITATMMIIKQKKRGFNLLIAFLNDTNEENLTRNSILRKAIEIAENKTLNMKISSKNY